ncbi:MAG: hypothetical protein U0271_22595 [Polyangiaceae bacterium]
MLSTSTQAWLRLADALGASPAVRAAVSEAVEEPAAYMREHASTLRERGLEGPTLPAPSELPFLALLDALDAEDRVALLDHRSAAEDVLDALRGLKPKRKLTWAWVKRHDEDALDDVGVERLLAAVAAEALPAELALANLDTRSDQLAVVIVEQPRISELIAAAKAVRHPAKRITPKALPAPKAKPSAVARAGVAMTDWPSCEADSNNSSRHFFHRERARSLWTRKWETAFDVMEGPAWEWSMEKDHRAFETPEACAQGYAAFVEALRGAGWLQFSEDEAKRELTAQQAARKSRSRR